MIAVDGEPAASGNFTNGYRSCIRIGALLVCLVALGIVSSAPASADDRRSGNDGHRGDSRDKGRDKDNRGDHHHGPFKKFVELQLLGFNDYHGHLERTTPGSVDGRPAGGSEFLAAKLKQLRQGHKHSLTVAAGDLIGGSPAFSGLFHDEPSVESLNAMGLDVSSVGNHEFDEGVAELLRMQRGGCHPVDGCYFPDQRYKGADFKWLAANVVDAKGRNPLPPYWIKKIDGVEVAFIGMTLESTNTLVAAAGIVGYKFLDEVETANYVVRRLQHKGVKAIVVLLHEGGIPSTVTVNGCEGISGPIVAIANGLSAEIDAVITGHTHLPYNCMLPDPKGKPRPVTSAYSFGRVVTEMNLVLNQHTGDVERDRTKVTNHAVFQDELTPDPALTAVIDKWTPLVADAANIPIGTITADIVRGGTPPGADRGVESPAGNLVADAQQWSTSAAGAVVAFMNSGGVRADLIYASSMTPPEGDGVVTFGEAFTFQPFGNTLMTFPMTGAQIVSVLEEQCQPAGSSRPFLHLGVSQGFSYDLQSTIVGADCTAVAISNVMLNGAPLDPSAGYMVTVNNFLADGGDNFATFATIDPSLRIGGGNDLEALVNYLGTFGPVAPPSVDRANELP
jgi:5'-nucleotidase